MIFEVARSIVRQALKNEEAKMMTIGAQLLTNDFEIISQQNWFQPILQQIKKTITDAICNPAQIILKAGMEFELS